MFQIPQERPMPKMPNAAQVAEDHNFTSSVVNVEFREEPRNTLGATVDGYADKLITAKNMHESGVTADTVMKVTGFQRTPDGRWERPSAGSANRLEVWVDVTSIQDAFKHTVPQLYEEVKARAGHSRPNMTTEARAGAALARYIVNEHDKWRAGIDGDVGETKFSQWPGITAGKANILIKFGITSVEKLARAEPHELARLPAFNGLDMLQHDARMFLRASDSQEAVRMLREEGEEKAKLQAQVDSLTKALTRTAEQMAAQRPAAVALSSNDDDDSGLPAQTKAKAEAFEPVVAKADAEEDDYGDEKPAKPAKPSRETLRMPNKAA